MLHKKMRSMAIDAMFLAIMAIMTFIPSLGFISLGGVISVTLLHIVVLIGACYGNTKKGALYGLYFGLLSLIKAATAPVSILDPYFVNPLISVLPRFIFGLLAGLSFSFIKKLKKASIKSFLVPFSAITLTMLHSVMVLGMLGIINGAKISDGSDVSYWVMMGSVLLSSSIPEAIVAGVVIWPVSVAIVPDIIKVSSKKDYSETLGYISLVLSPFIPPLALVIGGWGLHTAKKNSNNRGYFYNRMSLVCSSLMSIGWLVTYMLLMN